jgi:hypothetical protein
VYSLTPRMKEEGLPWYKEPSTLGWVVLAAGAACYIVFW